MILFIIRILHSCVLPPNFKYFVMYRKVKTEEGRWEKSYVFVRAFGFFFWLKPHVKLLEYCSVHIAEFMMQRVGIVYKM